MHARLITSRVRFDSGLRNNKWYDESMELNPWKPILSLIGIIIVAGVGYHVFQGDYIFDVLFPKNIISAQVLANVKQARDNFYRIVDPMVGPVVRQSEAVVNTIVGGIKDQVEKVIDGAKQETFNSAKDVINKQLAIIGDGIGVRSLTGEPENRVEYPMVLSVNTQTPITATQTAIEENGLPTALKKTQGKDGIFLMKNEDGGVKESFTILWKETKQSIATIGDAIAKTFDNIFMHNAEYRMSIPITKDGVTKKYSVYIVVEE